MLRFREFKKDKPETFIAFSNAGGRLGQYDKFDYTESYMHGQGGGGPIEENLNPRTKPIHILSNGIMFDPEKSDNGLGAEYNYPENIGVPNYYGTNYVSPNYTDEQAKNAKILSASVNEHHPFYHDILEHYTSNSYNLNNELIRHHRMNTDPPESIKSHLDRDDEDNYSDIHLHTFDKLIEDHKLPTDITVYSGLHFHPNEHRGKIAEVPSYMSTSLSPHVAKDFGKKWEMNYQDGKEFKHVEIKNILRLHLNKGQTGLFADNGSLFPGQGELILPRGMRYQFGQRPTHIIEGNFNNHFYNNRIGMRQYHIYTGRILQQ
jgi:hypothetical protein